MEKWPYLKKCTMIIDSDDDDDDGDGHRGRSCTNNLQKTGLERPSLELLTIYTVSRKKVPLIFLL